MKKILLRFIALIMSVAAIAICVASDINEHVISISDEFILSQEEASRITDVDCVLVLGCRVYGTDPSPLLLDRLKYGVSICKSGASEKILMSGDHGKKDYDEVNAMRKYAEDNGIPSECIFMDHAGFSTYESMYRARDVFCVKKLIIVTQGYHLSRAVYDARSLGLDAYGVACVDKEYPGRSQRESREFLARVKDFFYAAVKPKPTYLGEQIPITGSGISTYG